MKPCLPVGGACLTALILVSWPAQGETTSSAVAEALFQDAARLMDAGKVDEACSKLEHSHELEPLPGTLLRMALCHELQNKTATAYLEFSRGLAWAQRDGRADRIAFAQTHLEALKPKLARVAISVPPSLLGLQGLMVYMNGVSMPASAWGVATPVDPGTQVVKVAAKGHATAIVYTQAKAVETVTVVAPVPQPLPTTATPQNVGYAPPVGAAWAAAGVGVAGLAVAGVYGLRAINRSEEAQSRCGAGPVCADEGGLSANAEASSAARTANISAAVGVLGLGTAGLLLWWRRSASKPSVDVAVIGFPQGGGAMLIGGSL